jgi:carboxypeptidase Q
LVSKLPTLASRLGAVAALIRSLASYSLYTPHAGETGYADGVKPIPMAAVTVEDAEMMQRMQNRGQDIIVQLKMEGKNYGKSVSRNGISIYRLASDSLMSEIG